MMVTVKAMRCLNGHWYIEKQVECGEDDAKEYVKMFFDLGFEKVRVD